MEHIADIHNHIIFDVDDGPDSLESSMKMMRQAVDNGITDIVATPHQFEKDIADYANRQKIVLENFNTLQTEVQKAKLPLKLYLGAELYFTTQLVTVPQMPYLTVDDKKKYALIEFSMNWPPEGYKETFYELIQSGCTPILAHPERYSYFWEIAEDILDLVKMGTLLQINAGSLLGYMGPQAHFVSQMLLSEGLAHIIASDAHRASRAIGFNLTRAADAFREDMPHIDFDMLISVNPMNVIRGEPIEINDEPTYRFDKKFQYKKWRRFYFKHEILGFGRNPGVKRKKRHL
jgi:protein-tyrosine phosphatase